MIEGLCLEMSTEELRAYILSFAEHHRARATSYDELAKSFATDGEHSQAGLSLPGRADPRQRARHHSERATYLELLAKHLVSDEVYRLSENDLAQIADGQRTLKWRR